MLLDEAPEVKLAGRGRPAARGIRYHVMTN